MFVTNPLPFRRRSVLLLALVPLLLAGCGGGGASAPAADDDAAAAPSEEELRARAGQLAQDLLIVDTHVDVPYRLEEEWENIAEATEKGDFDYPRAREGGLDAPFMSIYIPASYQTSGGAAELADKLIDMVEGIASDNPDKFAVASSPAEVREIKESGRIALPLGMENGAPVEGDLANLQHFFDRGIRYITLTHSENNEICDSSYASDKQWDGLSPFGREVVAEMNRLGIMVDVSHVSDDAFWQVMDITKAPAIASHSSARYFTPGWERNMSDEMIRALAENGGVIHINFGSAFLRGDSQQSSAAFWAARRQFLEEAGVERDSPEAQAWIAEYRAENPQIFADISDVMAHIDHVVELVGIDHVGLGSDFDGVGDSLPTGLKDASYMPNLVYELLAAGYTEEDIEKILSGNVMRVWNEVERVAAELSAG